MFKGMLICQCYIMVEYCLHLIILLQNQCAFNKEVEERR